MICLFFKICISHALDRGRPLPGLLRRHLDRCPGCRRFQRLSASLLEGLSAAAIEERSGPSRLLLERVTAAVDGVERAIVPVGRSLGWSLKAAVPAAGAVLALLSGFLLLHHDGGKPVAQEESAAHEEGTALMTTIPQIEGGARTMGAARERVTTQAARGAREERVVQEAPSAREGLVAFDRPYLLWGRVILPRDIIKGTCAPWFAGLARPLADEAKRISKDAKCVTRLIAASIPDGWRSPRKAGSKEGG